MSKKRDNEELDRINALYDALFNDPDDVPIEDVRRLLADAGIDRAALRERLHAKASDLARTGRAEGRVVSPALRRLLDQTGDAASLPADPKRALEKAQQYLAELFGGGPTANDIQIVGAFRGDGELTDHDKDTLDEIDAELRARAEAEDDNEKE